MNDKQCPLCKSQEISTLKTFSLGEATKHIIGNKEALYKIISEYLSKNILHGTFVEFCLCHSCTFEFSHPFKAADSYIYNTLYKDSTINNSFWKWDFEVAYKLISKEIQTKIIDNEVSILDVGTGSGHFLKKISQIYENTECHAVEYSDNCRLSLEKLNISTYENLEEVISLSNMQSISFDYIVLFQVLEHIDNIDNIFSSLKKILKNNGKIIISTPNSLQRKYYDSLDIYEDVPPIHISRFNEKNFIYISKLYQLKLLKFTVEDSGILLKSVRFMNTKYKNQSFILKINSLPLGRYLKVIVYIPLLILNIKPIAGLIKQGMGTSQVAVMEHNNKNTA